MILQVRIPSAYIPLHEYIGSSPDVVCSSAGAAKCQLVLVLLCFQMELHQVMTQFAARNYEKYAQSVPSTSCYMMTTKETVNSYIYQDNKAGLLHLQSNTCCSSNSGSLVCMVPKLYPQYDVISTNKSKHTSCIIYQ